MYFYYWLSTIRNFCRAYIWCRTTHPRRNVGPWNASSSKVQMHHERCRYSRHDAQNDHEKEVNSCENNNNISLVNLHINSTDQGEIWHWMENPEFVNITLRPQRAVVRLSDVLCQREYDAEIPLPKDALNKDCSLLFLLVRGCNHLHSPDYRLRRTTRTTLVASQLLYIQGGPIN